MIDIGEMLYTSEMRTDILQIANALKSDSNYTKEDVIQDLLKFLEKHNL
ncbi:hypothetical protein [Peribacillus asahii]|nr:hypothetical protein [Peribacillus asahii]USK61300.1 hypothetical protein LIT37_08285 [Peribacillus asahii]